MARCEGLCQTLTEHKFREVGVLSLEQPLQEAWRHARTSRDHGDAWISVIEMGKDVRFDGLHRAEQKLGDKIKAIPTLDEV